MVREILPPETALAFAAMRALRPHFDDEAAWVTRVDGLQRPEGYRLAGAFEDGEPTAAAVAGFRLGHNLAWGRFLYVDDLSTRPDRRRRGYARELMDWLERVARRHDCDQLHLDSGVGPERADAHR
ncbi:MAG: GNAT family N-acetyltransferase, partial [Solirubrobacteraceae bacterium]